MASSVTVTINARDNTRAGVRSLRNNIDNLRRQLPPDHTIYVNLNDDQAFNRAGRLRRNLRNLPDNVVVRVNTVGPDSADRHRLVRTLGRSLAGPFRIMGRGLGGILSDGLGQGIIGAFQAAGPVGMAVLAGIILASLSLLGAALSGLIVAALGLAFVGVAGWSASTSKEVQSQWSKTLKSLKKNFKEVGEPMIPVLTRGIRKLEELGDKVAPVFKGAIEDAVPATNTFIDKLFEGVKRMGKAMFKPIMEAWEVFAPVFGDVFADFMEDVGENFADIADMVREHSVEIELALRLVFKMISGLIEIVEFFGRQWIMLVGTAGDAIGALIEFGLRPLATIALEVFEKILEGADFAFGWIPGVGDDLDAAKSSFSSFKDSALSSLDSIAQKAYSWDESMDRANKERVLKADITKWQGNLKKARKDLKKTTSQKAEAKVRANIDDLKRKVGQAQAELRKVRGKTIYLRTIREILTYSKTYRSVHDIVGKATGGNVGAAATGGVRRNQVLVGEQGPEIVDLPFGSRVKSNPDTRRQLAGYTMEGGPRNVEGVKLILEAGNSGLDRLLLHVLRNAIRSEGGDVQVVLGTRGR